MKKAIGNHKIDTHDICCLEAKSASAHQEDCKKNCKLYSVPTSISQWDLLDHFSKFGAVKYVYKPSAIRSVAYVSFVDVKSMDTATAERWHYIDGKKFGVNTKQGFEGGSSTNFNNNNLRPVKVFGGLW